MKVGDLVKMQPIGENHALYPPCCGVVSLVEKEFYRRRKSTGGWGSDFQDRITVVWQNGDESFEPKSFLEVVNESR